MAIRAKATMRRAEDGERLARLEEQTMAIRATLGDIQRGQESHYADISQTLREIREAKAREHEALHARITGIEVEQSGAAGKIAGAAAAASVGTGVIGWLMGLFSGKH